MSEQKRTWRIITTDWQCDRAALKAIRSEVFIREQQVPESMEWDEHDKTAIHFLAIERGSEAPIGTARLLPDGQIGRMAVLAPWRRKGIGTALLEAALKTCSHPPFLHAQVHALPFYAALGFIPVGEIFSEAGIPHQKMIHLV